MGVPRAIPLRVDGRPVARGLASQALRERRRAGETRAWCGLGVTSAWAPANARPGSAMTLHFRLPPCPALILLVAVIRAGTLSGDQTATLLDDDFGTLPARMFSAGVVGAQAEYHFVPAVAAQGNWQVSCFRSEESQRAWRVVRHRGRPAMWQASTSTEEDARYTHPMIVAGDPLWSDYTAMVEFEPESATHPVGLAFRYQNDRCYYFFGVARGRTVLTQVNHGSGVRTATVDMLAEAEIAWSPGRPLTARVTAEQDRIRAWIDDRLVADVRDATFPLGRIALLADGPAWFLRVQVTASSVAAAAIEAAIAARAATERRLQDANPRPVVWKRIATPGFGTSRQVRFGDLDADGPTCCSARCGAMGPRTATARSGASQP